LDKEPGYAYIARSNPDGSNPHWGRAGYQHIFIANADGSDVRRVTTGMHDNFDPVFSPDGQQICYASRRHYVKDNIPNPVGSELYVINIDGTHEVRITPPQLLGKHNLSPHLGSYATDSSPEWHE
jgi:Tol biopolymer transport system component